MPSGRDERWIRSLHVETLREEESVALKEVERLHAAGVGNDGPEVEAVDAAAELERLTAERQDLDGGREGHDARQVAHHGRPVGAEALQGE